MRDFGRKWEENRKLLTPAPTGNIRRPTVIPAPHRHSRAGGNPDPRLLLLKTTCESLENNPTRQPISLHWERAGVAVKTAPPAPYNPKMGDFGRKWEKNRKLLTPSIIPHPTRHSRSGGNRNPGPRLSSIGPPFSERAWSALALPNPAAQPKMASTLRLLIMG